MFISIRCAGHNPQGKALAGATLIAPTAPHPVQLGPDHLPPREGSSLSRRAFSSILTAQYSLSGGRGMPPPLPCHAGGFYRSYDATAEGIPKKVKNPGLGVAMGRGKWYDYVNLAGDGQMPDNSPRDCFQSKIRRTALSICSSEMRPSRMASSTAAYCSGKSLEISRSFPARTARTAASPTP